MAQALAWAWLRLFSNSSITALPFRGA